MDFDCYQIEDFDATMRVFMLGWEFPPFISGGLGTACHGLTKAMSGLGIEVTFVVPKAVNSDSSTHVKMLSPLQCQAPKACSVSKSYEEQVEEKFSNVSFRHIPSALEAYTTPEYYKHKIEDILTLRSKQTITEEGIDPAIEDWLHETDPVVPTEEHYSNDMYSEIHRYAAYAVRLAIQEDFDGLYFNHFSVKPDQGFLYWEFEIEHSDLEAAYKETVEAINAIRSWEVGRHAA